MKTAYLYVIPAMLYITIWTIYPLVSLLYTSLTNLNLFHITSSFVGIQNYVAAFTNTPLIASVYVTIGYSTFVTVTELVLGMGIALLLSRKGRLASFARLVMILPLTMTPFLIYMTWKFLLTPGTGPIPYVFQTLFNQPNPIFFSLVPQVYVSLLVIDIWQYLPFVVIILIAGISAIPSAPLEAAEIDGASAWRKFVSISLPYLRMPIIVIVLFRIIDTVNVFEPAWLLTGGGPGLATTFLSFLIYQTGPGLKGDFGLGSAEAIVLLVIALAISWTIMYFLFRRR